MTRHRRAPMWRRLFPRPTEPVTEPMPIPEPVVVDNPAEFVRAVQMLDAGVSAHRQQPDRAHLDRHGPFLLPGAVVPPPAMPGGA